MFFSVPAQPTIRAPDGLVDEVGGRPRLFCTRTAISVLDLYSVRDGELGSTDRKSVV